LVKETPISVSLIYLYFGGFDLIILCRNECPYPPSPLVRKYIVEYSDHVNRYEIPGLEDKLVELLAKYVGVDKEYVHMISGSEAFFVSLPWAMVKHGYRFIYSSPTFAPAVDDLRVWGIRVVDVPLTSDFRVDVDSVLKHSGHDSILYIVRPNNPTGNDPITCEEIEDLVDSFKVVIIDEAYYEFSGLTCVDLVKSYDNIVVLRTFSKAFCLAGARLAYVITSPETYKEFFGIRRKYDIPVLSLLAGLGAIEDLGYMRKVVEDIIRVKKWVVEELRKRENTVVIDTLTNFILVGKKGYDSHSLFIALKERGVLVKELDGRLRDYVRVSIGKFDEMKFFLKALDEI